MAIVTSLPELILFLGALIILMNDVFFGKKFQDNSRIVLVGAFAVAFSALFAVLYNYGDNYYSNIVGAIAILACIAH